MPRIPQADRTRRAVAPALGSLAAAAAPGEAVARGAGQLTNQLTGFFRQQQQKQQLRQVNEGETKLVTLAAELRQEARKRSDFETFPQEILERYEQGAAQALGEIDDPDVQARLQNTFERARAGLGEQLGARAFGLEQAASVRALEGAIKSDIQSLTTHELGAAGEEGRLADLQSAIVRIRASGEAGHFAEPGTEGKLLRGARSEAAQGYANQILLAVGTDEQLPFDEAEAILRDPEHPILSALDEGQRRAFVETLQQKATAQARENAAQRDKSLGLKRAGYYEAIARATEQDAGLLKQKIVQESWGPNSAFKEEGQQVAALKALDARILKLEEDYGHRRLMHRAIFDPSVNPPDTPENREALDHFIEPALAELDVIRREGPKPKEMQQLYAEIGQATGNTSILAPSLKQTIESSLKSSDPETVLHGVTMYQAINQQKNGALLTETFRDDLRTETITTLTTNGETPQRAIELADLAIKQSKEERGRREDLWRSGQLADQAESEIVDAFDGWFDEELPDQAIAEMQAAARANFMLNGKADAAIRAAITSGRRKWHPTEVATEGRTEYAPNAIERYYPSLGKEEIERQLFSDVSEVAKIPNEELRIFPLPFPVAGEPAWVVKRKDSDGQLHSIPTAKSSELYFTPSVDNAAENLRQRNELFAQADQAREAAIRDAHLYSPFSFAGQLD